MRSISLISLLLAVTSVLALSADSAVESSLFERSTIEGAQFDRRTGMLTWEDAEAPLAKRDGEISFMASFEVTKRDTSEAGSSLEKRGRRNRHKKSKSKKSKKSSKKSKSKKKKTSTSSSGGDVPPDATWYTKKDLLNPSCGRKSHWTPTDRSLVVAPTERWAHRPACGSFLRITAPGSKKSVVVRVWDTCGGCAPNVPHVDLTIAAFTKLWPQAVGLVKGVHVQVLSGPPFNPTKWDSHMVALYGPKTQ
ncbi:BZ3500_MvSof-1268-A1-R1_Chr10-2g02955 [Microbotryum saponariae]|uniref:BZ3500_MvSof-1268-A1-R1_Chr10-2g02955 protein n=1 Tax=Microbotryum saponariae TaxID=289078 RepID=A0A2X0KQL5_9BASI|nr:BZ3501_MvSof-1269-A2-R1_Chr10-2g02541 [Microbotryum saponariae]SDA01814.1 BZ3500_MvSof-1268-A1-R1_Chr10-2g02955 [Microbotryum saponariae]